MEQDSLSSSFIVKTRRFFANILKDTGSSFATAYNDTTLVCKDKTIFINRVLLSVAFPSLESAMYSLGQVLDLVVILPEYTVSELTDMIQTLLSDIKQEKGSDDDGNYSETGIMDTIVDPICHEKIGKVAKKEVGEYSNKESVEEGNTEEDEEDSIIPSNTSENGEESSKTLSFESKPGQLIDQAKN